MTLCLGFNIHWEFKLLLFEISLVNFTSENIGYNLLLFEMDFYLLHALIIEFKM